KKSVNDYMTVMNNKSATDDEKAKAKADVQGSYGRLLDLQQKFLIPETGKKGKGGGGGQGGGKKSDGGGGIGGFFSRMFKPEAPQLFAQAAIQMARQTGGVPPIPPPSPQDELAE